MFMFAFYDILYKFYIGTVLYYITVERKYIVNSSTYPNVIDAVLNAYNIRRNYKIFINDYIDKYITPNSLSSISMTIKLLNVLHTKLQVLGIFIIIPERSTIKLVKNKIVDINNIVMNVEEINKIYQDLKDMYYYV